MIGATPVCEAALPPKKITSLDIIMFVTRELFVLASSTLIRATPVCEASLAALPHKKLFGHSN